MSTIPDTRSRDAHRRINIPADTLDAFPDVEAFSARMSGTDIVLSPTARDAGCVVTEKNRIRLPTEVAANYDDDETFAVIEQGDCIVLRPIDEIDIDI